MKGKRFDVKQFLGKNSVPVLFIIICAVLIPVSGLPVSYILNEAMTRLGRNAFLILSLLIGAAVFALLLFLQKTRFGFWVIGVLLSAAWAVIFGLLAFIISNADQLWFYVVCGLAFIVMLLLHIKARDKA